MCPRHPRSSAVARQPRPLGPHAWTATVSLPGRSRERPPQLERVLAARRPPRCARGDAVLVDDRDPPQAASARLPEPEADLDAAVACAEAERRAAPRAADAGDAHLAPPPPPPWSSPRASAPPPRTRQDAAREGRGGSRPPVCGDLTDRRNGTLVRVSGERSSRSPWRSAHSTACTRSVTSICRKMFVRCVFTVFSLMPSRCAISLFGSPSSSSANTSRSRGEIPSSGSGASLASSRSRAAWGSSGAPPSAAARMPRTTSSAEAVLEEIAGGAGAQRRRDPAHVGERREDEHRRPGALLPDDAGRLDSVEHRHLEVHQDDVGRRACGTTRPPRRRSRPWRPLRDPAARRSRPRARRGRRRGRRR